MKIKLYLDKIEVLLQAMQEKDEMERLQSYAALVAIIDLIEQQTASGKYQHGIFEGYKASLLSACQGICGLDDVGKTEEEAFAAAKQALEEIRSRFCLDCIVK